MKIPLPTPRRHVLAPWVVLGVFWAGFSAWCVQGIPPCVDLPAHAAQVQTLVELLRGNAEVARFYVPSFPIGYGLTTWLFVPLAWLANGAFAARFATWLALMLFPIAHGVLARSWGRSLGSVVLGLPLAFNLSYWFGFLPTFFALPWVLLGWGLFSRSAQRDDASPGTKAGLVLLSTGVMLSHLVALGVLTVGVLALALTAPKRVRALRLAAVTLALPFALCAARIALLVDRAAKPLDDKGFEYDLVGHLNWNFRAQGTQGRVAILCGVVLAAVMIVAWWRRQKLEPQGPAALTAALLMFYLATPKAFSGAWLVSARLPVMIAFAALLLVDMRTLPRYVQAFALALVLVAVGAVGQFHSVFKREVAGLDELASRPVPRGVNGGLSLAGLQLPESRSRIRFLEHLPQWWTATGGGVGNHFFADADRQPVRFTPEHANLPALLGPDLTKEAGAPFGGLLVFGEGPLPPAFEGMVERERSGRWRRFERACY